ncbi:hypothetical protein GCM10017786_03410 [Amycolatopsis deserti]|uniref:Helix-hairpin-helix domain-containing protein n=1 Tax=Amycolatopsis deserti TaxID=185696 RepID=A0ABQ3IDU5_9PSEU|nr:hypothetical protein [Amycolatopsis deserti]GHE77358.1 hypothetical protein GCM10017786_03410 [Amycolatopsis deserti]
MTQRTQRHFTGWWYLPLTILSLGLLTWVPFVHAAARLRRPRIHLWAVLYFALMVFVLVTLPPYTETPTPAENTRANIGVAMILAIVGAASVQQFFLRRTRTAPRPEEDPAVARVRAARERRRQARELAANDPAMARELGIGRPDLSRDYDDGGLVDLNAAPASAIAETCGIDPAVAQRIVDARAGARFAAVDDVFALTELPLETWDVVRERGIVY